MRTSLAAGLLAGMLAAAPTGRTARVLARNRLSARLLGSPAIAADELFFRSDDSLYAIGG